MSSTNEESPTTFSTKTREWLNSLNSKPTSSQVTRHEEKSQFPSLFSSGNDPYSNLDTEQKRMPDLLVDNSFTHSRKRVWIGGKTFLFDIIHSWLPNKGWASSNAARRRCPAAPSNLSKSWWAIAHPPLTPLSY